MNRSFIIRFAVGALLVTTLTLLFAFNGLLLWVATGPRSLERFTPYIERSLSGESGIKVDIGETWLLWGGWKHPIDLRLSNIELYTKEGVLFSTFPQISLGLDVLALPFGQVLPTSLSVERPVISIKQNEDKSIGLAAKPEGSEISSTTDTISALVQAIISPNPKSTLRKLSSVELLHADVSLGNDKDGVVIAAPDTTFIVRREMDDRVNIVLSTVLGYREYETPVSARLGFERGSKELEGIMEVTRLHPAALSDILTNDPSLQALQFPVSGKIGFAFDDQGALDALKFVLNGGRGKIVHEKLDGTMSIDKLNIAGNAHHKLTELNIEQLSAEIAGSPLTASAHITRADAGIGITGNASLLDVAGEKVKLFWPLGLAPLSREWVVTNIREGVATKASVTMNIQPGDLDKPALPKEAIHAVIELKDAKIKYLDGHPEIRNVNAAIVVDGESLDAAISSASGFSDTKLSQGRVLIADLVPDNPLIEVSLHADAPASDIVTLLTLPMLEHAKHLNLDAKKVTGRAEGDAKLGFYFFEKDEDGNELPFTYDIKAKVKAINTPQFLDRFDIAGANGDLSIDEKAILFTGDAEVNGATITGGSIRYAMEPEGAVDTTISGTASFDEASLARFGVKLPIRTEPVKAAAIAIDLSSHKDTTSIPKFTVKGEGINVAGSTVLTPDGKDVATLKLTNMQYGASDLSGLEYTTIPGGYNLSITGRSLDVSSMFEGESEEGFSFEGFPAIGLALDVGTLIAGYKQELTNVKGTLTCSTEKCTKANIEGLINDKKINFNITPEGRNRRLSATSEDAGAAVKALGITDSMEGGALALTGQYDDAAGKGILRGKLLIRDHTLKNAPNLAKLLSLASLTGFFDTLSGKGIAFKKLEAPFTLENDVAVLKDARTYGPAIGLTADGTITFPKADLDLKGTIVPSYTLNNVVGNVPVLGDLLTGGEGQGVFAANFTMKGDSDDPDVAVNPLSMLTPGFLRHLFDAF